MHLAAKEYLLTQGADIDYTGFSEGAVLMLVAGAGAVDIVQRLIELGAEVNLAMPNRGETALHFAAAYGDTEMVQALLASGGDKTIPDGYGDRSGVYLRRHHRTTPHFVEINSLLK